MTTQTQPGSNRLPLPSTPARSLTLLLIATLAVTALLSTARPARAAATSTVNMVGDAGDLNPNDNLCDASADGGAQCTLRAAIQQANASAGANTIVFNISGPGVKTIRPLQSLPTITQTVTIDGYTQPGVSANTAAVGTNAVLRIVLDGINTGAVDGLTINAKNSLVRGLSIRRFGESGIEVNGPQGNGTRIAGCFLGVDPAGSFSQGNVGAGVTSRGADVTIGGATRAARNLIGNNAGPGVLFFEAPSGSIQGNLIGLSKSGTDRLGNGGARVLIQSSSNVTVGGNTAPVANDIAFNGGDGVLVAISGNGNRVLRNAIFSNSDEGIDLLTDVADEGPTPNDAGDGDAGPNGFQNKPTLAAAASSATATDIIGSLNSTPNRTFVVRFFSNPQGGAQAKVFRGQQSVSTDGSGNASIDFTTASAIPVDQTVTATATDANGNTSELSSPIRVKSDEGNRRSGEGARR